MINQKQLDRWSSYFLSVCLVGSVLVTTALVAHAVETVIIQCEKTAYVIQSNARIRVTQADRFISPTSTFSDPTDAPPDSPGPSVPKFQEVKGRVANFLQQVPYPDRYKFAQALAIGYQIILSHLPSSPVSPSDQPFDPETIAQAQEQYNLFILTKFDEPEYAEFVSNVSSMLGTFYSEGKIQTLEDYKAIWGQIIDGLEHIPESQVLELRRNRKDRLNLPQLLLFIMKILEILRELGVLT